MQSKSNSNANMVKEQSFTVSFIIIPRAFGIKKKKLSEEAGLDFPKMTFAMLR